MTAERPTTVAPRGEARPPTPPRPSGLPGPRTFTVAFGLVLFLVTTGRWGSHIGQPGGPLFVSDVVLAVALAQTAVAVRRRGTRLGDLGRSARTAHLALLLTASLLAWVALRALLGPDEIVGTPLAALRDLAPYAYMVVALVAFLLPVSGGPPLRQVVYGALAVHVVWALGAPLLPGWPGAWPQLGDAAVFTTRPDFDSAVFGVAVALALHDLLAPGRAMRSARSAGLVLMVLANGYAITDSATRAGLLSALVSVGAVVLARVLGRSWTSSSPPGWSARGVALGTAAAFVLVATVGLSPAGQRIVESVRGDEGSASGTLAAREYTWSGVTRYVLSDARRTAAGVGFGPDFVTDSGTSFALEGTEYEDVRSPHNYLVGTLARLGVFGALLAGSVMVAAAGLGLRVLRSRPDTVSVLAALLVLALPVPALLGVILESPFGAIPYFWAVGHLARHLQDRRHEESAGDVLPVPVVGALEPVAQPDLGLPAERLDP